MKEIKKHLKDKFEADVRSIISLTIITFIVLYLFKRILMYFYHFNDYEGAGNNAFYLTLTMMILILITYIFKLISLFNARYSGIAEEYKIYSLKDKSYIKGEFWLGCGRIDKIDYYIFYEDGDFGYVEGKVRCSGVEIIEGNDIKPSFKTIYIEGTPKDFLFVPRNTIKKKFNI